MSSGCRWMQAFYNLVFACILCMIQVRACQDSHSVKSYQPGARSI
jgi:hypothetical protein